MRKKISTLIAALALAAWAVPFTSPAQEPEPAETEAAADAEAAREAAERSLQEARTRLEQARRDLEAAAREVAEQSGRARAREFRTFMRPRWIGGPQLGLSIAAAPDNGGVRVLAVTPGGPAAEAGVETGDVVTAIDGVGLTGTTTAADRLLEHMRQVEDGAAVVLDVVRGGAAREITVTARELDSPYVYVTGPMGGSNVVVAPGGSDFDFDFDFGDGWPGMRRFNVLLGSHMGGLELARLSPELGSYFGTTDGLLVVRAPEDGPIGLEDGDVILDIGGRVPTGPEHAMRIFMSFEPGETLRVTILRRQVREVLEYTIPEAGRDG